MNGKQPQALAGKIAPTQGRSACHPNGWSWRAHPALACLQGAMGSKLTEVGQEVGT